LTVQDHPVKISNAALEAAKSIHYWKSNCDIVECKHISEVLEIATIIERKANCNEMIEILKALPLDSFGEDMSKCDAADFVDHAGEFFSVMLKAKELINRVEETA
jgi:hypothetical protein